MINNVCQSISLSYISQTLLNLVRSSTICTKPKFNFIHPSLAEQSQRLTSFTRAGAMVITLVLCVTDVHLLLFIHLHQNPEQRSQQKESLMMRWIDGDDCHCLFVTDINRSINNRCAYTISKILFFIVLNIKENEIFLSI